MRESKEKTWVELELHCHVVTHKAAMLSVDAEESSAVWIPKSQIKGNLERDTMVNIEVAEWIAEREGLI